MRYFIKIEGDTEDLKAQKVNSNLQDILLVFYLLNRAVRNMGDIKRIEMGAIIIPPGSLPPNKQEG